MAKINIDIAVNQRDAQAKIDKLTKSTKSATQGFDRLSLSVKQSSAAFGSFVGNVAAIGFTRLIGGLTNLATSGIKAAADLETLSTQFQVLTGNAGTANKAIQDLQKFAASTPFRFQELAETQKTLLAFQFSVEESQELLSELGDVAAATGKPIKDLALIFGQVSAAGKLTGERLLQLEERSIPIGPALAKSMGVAESAVRELVSQGKVSFADFEKAFKTLNDTGEFAFEGMIKRSQTLTGRLSTLQDNFQLLQISIAQKLGPAFKAMLTTVTLFIQRIQNSTQFNNFLTFIGENIPNAIEFAINSFSFIINAVFNTIKVFNLFRSGVTTAISIVIDAFTKFIDIYAKVINALGLGDTALGRGINSIKDFKTNVIESLDATAAGFAESAAEIDRSQELVNQAINKGKDFVIKTLQEETAAAQAQADAIVQANEKKKASGQALTASEIAEQQKRLEAARKLEEELKALELERQEAIAANDLFKTEAEVLFQEEKLIRLEEFFTREEEARIQAAINAEENEKLKQKLILEAQIEGEKRRLKSAQAQKNAEFQLNRQGFERLGSATAQGFGALATLARQGGEKQFGVFKALSKAQAIVNGIAAVSEAARQPYPINIPLTIKAVAESAARVSAINSARPSFEQGGIVPGTSFSGDNVTANVNSGEMILNRQQQAQLFNLANGARGGNNSGAVVNQPIIIELDNEVIGRATSKWVANGGQLGEVQ